MNKYRAISRRLARARKNMKMCLGKKAFPTQEAAYQKGQDTYRCPNCHRWHRTGAAATLAAKVRGKR